MGILSVKRTFWTIESQDFGRGFYDFMRVDWSIVVLSELKSSMPSQSLIKARGVINILLTSLFSLGFYGPARFATKLSP